MIDCHDPLAVFRAAVDAVNAEDWPAAAALVDPECLRMFHQGAITGLTQQGPAEAPTADWFLSRAPNLSRARAEELAARAAQETDRAYRLAREFPSVASIDELQSLTPTELFSRWLDGKSMRRKFQRLIAAGSLPANTLERYGDAPVRGGLRYVPVGSVAEGEAYMHVLYRPDFFPRGRVVRHVAPPDRRPSEEQLRQRHLGFRTMLYVATLLRQPDGCWLFVVIHDFLRMAARHEEGVALLVPRDDPDGPSSV